tara:strand:- start:223 stop:1323 length:1101 start_codon:yes stop_codon:yes gene_type:complete
MKINHLDLFSGAGGFSLALHKVIGEENIGWVGYSDIDKYANETFKRRFPNAERLGSITDIKTEGLPRIDLVTFGFPCQDLSIAGRRKGFKGERSSLFYEATRIIRSTRPKYFIFENVKGTFSSNQGKDFTLILQEIADIGYDGQWQLLNTRWFLPQNRERVYFVGHIRGRSRPKVFPIGESSKSAASKQKKRDAISCIDASYYKGVDGKRTMIQTPLKQIGVIGKDSEATRVYDSNGISRTIKNGGGMGAKTGLYKIREATKKGYAEADIGDSINFSVPDSKTRRGRVGKGVAQTLDTASNQATIQDTSIRRLTPTECERLQGFPDGWTDHLSDTQRYKQMGNAITVDVAEAIYRKLYKENYEPSK